ncbi:MAG: pyridoxamine 5'-phosphate oxidase [Candidatus Dormibacteria bacterium]
MTMRDARFPSPADLDPIPLLLGWMREAEAAAPGWAAALATATGDGRPSVRMVLVKEVTPRGLIFYSDGGSRKGTELRLNPRAAVCLHWPTLGRQLRAEGKVRRLPATKVDSYFHSRPRISQLAAAVSHQSRPAPSRPELEARVDHLAVELDGAEVPRPRRWAGYQLEYEVVEFWHEGPGRLHHRVEYRRLGSQWQVRELQP